MNWFKKLKTIFIKEKPALPPPPQLPQIEPPKPTIPGRRGVYNAERYEKAKRTKAAKGLSMKGKNNPMYGKHHSEEVKQIIREARLRCDPSKTGMSGKSQSEEFRENFRKWMAKSREDRRKAKIEEQKKKWLV